VEALQEPLEDIVKMIRKVMEKTPPELVSDIIDRGAAMCGGGSLLRGIDKYLTKSIGIPVYMVDNPLTCTAEGAVKRSNSVSNYEKASLQHNKKLPRKIEGVSYKFRT